MIKSYRTLENGCIPMRCSGRMMIERL